MTLPTPHLDKLRALLENDKLPVEDRARIDEAIAKYQEWIQAMARVQGEQEAIIDRLVSLLTEYKQFIDLDTIFDSESSFLYRQKGQLKLDNSVIEEFLPHLVSKTLPELDNTLHIGPQSCFSAAYFASTLTRNEDGEACILEQKIKTFLWQERCIYAPPMTWTLMMSI